jgi:hypothetical protein
MKITSTSDWREEIPFETPMIVASLVPGEPGVRVSGAAVPLA